MPLTLRSMIDKGFTEIRAYGTSEGATAGWDARGRGRITDSKPHQKLMINLHRRTGVLGRQRGDDDDKNFKRMTAPKATRNDKEHQMAKELESQGHLKRAAGSWDKNGHSAWNITEKGHVGFNLDQY